MKLRIVVGLCAGVLCANPIFAKISHKSAATKPKTALQWPRFQQMAHGDYIGEFAALQYLLRYHGVKAQPDGIFHKKTEAAVKQFQKKRGLKADGIAGPQTLEKLIVHLKRGDKSEAVKALQAMLNSMITESGESVYPTKVDGVFGFGTEKVVREFQTNSSLKSDGIVGAATWCILLGGKVKK